MKFIKVLLLSLALAVPVFASSAETPAPATTPSATAISLSRTAVLDGAKTVATGRGGVTKIRPVGGADAWELHVMGNGSTIASIMESIKLVILGNKSFLSLLLFMGVTGFCILAIQAGFNPGANLFKMFGYILVTWVVTLSATRMTADVAVVDPINNYVNVVQNVPAIVAIPSALVSEVGHYLTTTIQTAYSTPGEFDLTNGGFDIFNKITRDLDTYKITRPELQKSMGAFVTDCAIGAIAQNRMTAAELMFSKNLWKTLEKAKSGVFLTRYYPPVPSDGKAAPSIVTASQAVSCTWAYDQLHTQLQEHAQRMMEASSKEWTASGIMIPYEQMMQSYMEAAHIGNTGGGGAYARPTSMILQKSLINTMSGDFREAAIQSGNNEVLMGVSISQAEQSQKSGWVTSAAVFKNMMGYVYTTLQAFIFAVVPIMIVALMIPGLGKKIFVNYGQILVWLTLWEPMLSIVNYLVTLFNMDAVQKAMANSGGFTAANTWIISEAGNNMVVAASFLATMVPLLCWGLVNGAMAFTEFISHGIGSSFAMQAGAQAATGSASLNNMSMNNMSSNKFDNAHKSTVGNQTVMAFENAGALETQNNKGGHAATANGGSITQKSSVGKNDGDSFAHAKGATIGDALNKGHSNEHKLAASDSAGSKKSAESSQHRGHELASSTGESNVKSAGDSDATARASQISTAASNKDSVNTSLAMTSSMEMSGKNGKGGVGGGGPGAGGAADAAGGGKNGVNVPVKGGIGGNTTQSSGQEISKSSSVASSTNHSANTSNTNALNKSLNDSNNTGERTSLSRGAHSGHETSDSLGATESNSYTHSAATSESQTHSHTSGSSYSSTLEWASAITDDDIMVAQAYENSGGPLSSQMAEMNSFYAGARAEFAAGVATYNAAHHNLMGAGHGGALGMDSSIGGAASSGSFFAKGEGAGAMSAMRNDVLGGVAAGVSAASGAISGAIPGAQSWGAHQNGLVGTGDANNPLGVTTDNFDAKKTAVGVGAGAATAAGIFNMAAGSVAGASMLSSASTGFTALRSGAAASSLMGVAGTSLGAAGAGTIGAAGLAGFGAGYGIGTYAVNPALRATGLDAYVSAGLEPVFKAVDGATNNYFR